MTKYYIRSVFMDWFQVSKDRYDDYKIFIYNKIADGKSEKCKQEIVNRYCKEILQRD